MNIKLEEILSFMKSPCDSCPNDVTPEESDYAAVHNTGFLPECEEWTCGHQIDREIWIHRANGILKLIEERYKQEAD